MKLSKKALLPLGFTASGINCGIKKSGKPDLALFYSQVPAKAACMFTTNKIVAAPVILSRGFLKKNQDFRALIANSGNANCFTGKKGLVDAGITAGVASRNLGIKKEAVLVASTGIIGKPLPLEKIKSGIPDLVKGLSASGIDQAKLAILTTDTFAKEITLQFEIGKKKVTLSGVAKGSGMIAPNLATMFAFIFSDANIAQGALKKALKLAVEKSFNCITVDGCMSTNDMVAVLANGMAGNRLIQKGGDFLVFCRALEAVCLELAKLLVRDGEGATKFIQIQVNQAKNYAQARKAALFIANSNLFKTAVYGENPNFGRIAASVGASGIRVEEKGFKIRVSPLKKKDVFVQVWLGQGSSSAVVYTSDLTPEYIKINAEYN